MESNRKRCKVVMLPTEDESGIYTFAADELIFNPQGECLHTRGNQHLYFTTDEEIKPFEKCWVFDSEDNSVFYNGREENTKGLTHTNFFHKIIATTDPKLCIKLHKGEVVDKSYPSKFHYRLPQPSQAFIEKYCKLGGIEYVDVEYTLTQSIKNKLISGNMMKANESHFIPEVDSHNTITIHAIKDSWSREEVIELLHKSLDATKTSHPKLREVFKEQMDKFIEENL